MRPFITYIVINADLLKIRTHFRAIHWFSLLFSIGITAGLWIWLLNWGGISGKALIGWWLLYLFVLFLGIGLLFPYFPHQCYKCGNSIISYNDPKNYSKVENVYDVIDIPKDWLHTHDEPEKDLWKDIRGIPLFLLVIIGVLLMPVIILVGMPVSYIYSKIGKNK